MTSTRISIALCTYNGAAYLEEQLSSFSAQTLAPFELIVCDDISTDNTSAIVATFAKTAEFPVHFYVNQTRLGSTLNFDRAIAFCRGDVIALSDQDDVWHEDKLRCLAGLLAVPEVVAAFSDADVTDENLVPLGYSMWRRLSFNEKEQSRMKNGQALDVLLKRYVVMGATLAFHANLRSLILPIPRGWHHDAWIALIAASVGRIGFDKGALVKYRQHSKNQIGARKLSMVAQIKNAVSIDRHAYLERELIHWQELLQRLHGPKDIQAESIVAKLEHLKRRRNFPSSRLKRLRHILKEIQCQGYARYSRNWGSIAMDLLIR